MSDQTAADRSIRAGDLLGGTDHDFVVDLYLALLRRWPDPGGYRRYLDQVAGRPERRIDSLQEVAASEEASRLRPRVTFDATGVVPLSPTRALAASLTLRTEWLHNQLARLEEAVGLLGGVGFAGDLIESRDAAVRFEINALRRDLTDRLDALAAPVGGEAAVAAVAQLVARHAGDLVAAAAAGTELRQQALEARVLTLEALLQQQDARIRALEARLPR